MTVTTPRPHADDLPTEAPAYRLTISPGQFGAPESMKLADELPLRIGDEVNALVRIRVTGRAEREPMAAWDTHTVTTDAKIVEFVEVDGTPIPTPPPAAAEAKVEATRKGAHHVDLAFAFVFGVFVTLTVLGVVASIH